MPKVDVEWVRDGSVIGHVISGGKHLYVVINPNSDPREIDRVVRTYARAISDKLDVGRWTVRVKDRVYVIEVYEYPKELAIDPKYVVEIYRTNPWGGKDRIGVISASKLPVGIYAVQLVLTAIIKEKRSTSYL